MKAKFASNFSSVRMPNVSKPGLLLNNTVIKLRKWVLRQGRWICYPAYLHTHESNHSRRWWLSSQAMIEPPRGRRQVVVWRSGDLVQPSVSRATSPFTKMRCTSQDIHVRPALMKWHCSHLKKTQDTAILGNVFASPLFNIVTWKWD